MTLAARATTLRTESSAGVLRPPEAASVSSIILILDDECAIDREVSAAENTLQGMVLAEPDDFGA